MSAVSKPHIVHLVPVRRLWRTSCGLPVESPDMPWKPGLVPDSDWTGPLGEITCGNCKATLLYPESARAGEYAE